MNNDDLLLIKEIINVVDDSELEIKETDKYKKFSKKVKLISRQIEEAKKYNETMAEIQSEIDNIK